MNSKYTREVLEPAVTASTSIAGVCRYLGLKLHGSTQTYIKKRIALEGIDTSHFTGSGHNKGKTAHNRKGPEHFFVVLEAHKERTHGHLLRRALIESDVKEECVECSITNTWNGKPIVLEVDHIDGNWYNNLKENLRFLCPNCHSQQETTKRTNNGAST